MSHEIGTTPWTKIGIDICYIEGMALLVISDYFTNYITVRRLREQSTREVIKELLAIFSIHGIPEYIVCDNGPQFRILFADFAKDYDITVVNSSPYLPRSNGKAENAVKTIKRIFKKCKDTQKSEQLALFDYNRTPSEGILLWCRSLMPITKEILKLRHNTEEERRKIEKTKDKQAYYYNQNICSPKEIRKGDMVRIRKLTEDRWSLVK